MYNCTIHGQKKTDWCDECEKLLLCDCKDQDSARFKDLIYDVDCIGERTVTVTIYFCKTCGDAIRSEI